MSEETTILADEVWDIEPLVDHVLASSVEEVAQTAQSALTVLANRFPPELWHVIDDGPAAYGPGAHVNLYKTEIQKQFQTWLASHQIVAEDYGGIVGPIQYVGVQMSLKSVMPTAKSNQGWRVRVIGFPALKLVACGLASHYQGTQNQNAMGHASQRIRERALEMLSPRTMNFLADWPSATSDHWEGRGLMPEPITRLGSLDISDFDKGKGALLRMVRNTTMKKELATFFAIKGMSRQGFIDDGPGLLENLQVVALELGGGASE